MPEIPVAGPLVEGGVFDMPTRPDVWLANCYFSSNRACNIVHPVAGLGRVALVVADYKGIRDGQHFRQGQRRLRLLRGNRLSAWPQILQIIAPKRLQMRPHRV